MKTKYRSLDVLEQFAEAISRFIYLHIDEVILEFKYFTKFDELRTIKIFTDYVRSVDNTINDMFIIY
jgi:hypothetical protein